MHYHTESNNSPLSPPFLGLSLFLFLHICVLLSFRFPVLHSSPLSLSLFRFISLFLHPPSVLHPSLRSNLYIYSHYTHHQYIPTYLGCSCVRGGWDPEGESEKEGGEGGEPKREKRTCWFPRDQRRTSSRKPSEERNRDRKRDAGWREKEHRRETRRDKDKDGEEGGAVGQGWNFRAGASLKIHAARNTERELESARIHASAATDERTDEPSEFSQAANTGGDAAPCHPRIQESSLDGPSAPWETVDSNGNDTAPLIVKHSAIHCRATIIRDNGERKHPLPPRCRVLARSRGMRLVEVTFGDLDSVSEIRFWVGRYKEFWDSFYLIGISVDVCLMKCI